MLKNMEIKKDDRENLPEEIFTREFVVIMKKEIERKNTLPDIAKTIGEIRSKQKPPTDDKDDVDVMIMEEMKKFNQNTIKFDKFEKDDKAKLDSMSKLTHIPKIETNFAIPFDDNATMFSGGSNFPMSTSNKLNESLFSGYGFNRTKFSN